MMKVLVVGSFHLPENATPNQQQQYGTLKQQFNAACKALGAAFAGRNHSIMVGVPDWAMLRTHETVASYMVEGASLAPLQDSQAHQIIFYAPQEPEPPDSTPEVDTLREFKQLPNLQIADKFVGRVGNKASVIPNVNEVDAVLLIAGAEGTASIGYAAYSMSKPVVVVTAFNGAAKDLHDDVLIGEYNRFLAQNNITPTDLRALECNWNADADNGALDAENLANAKLIVQTAEKLVKAYGQTSQASLLTLKWAIAGLVVLLLTWLGVYVSASQCPTTALACVIYVNVAFFLLLYISALLGTGLRILTSYQNNTILQLTNLGLAVDGAISLVVAFGLALLYLIGGISFTGKVVALQTGTPESNAFATIAITMAVLGLAAGYLVPLNRLRERLEGVMAQEGK